jgi:putative membrane protein
MIKKSNIDLDEPSHQPPKSILVIFWKSFGGIIRSFWPVLLYFFVSSNKGSNWPLIIGSAGVGLISFFIGTLRYYHFLYHVENKSLVISSGLFTKVTQNIPFERIQSIRLEQKFIHRLLNLYSVRVDTAGSSKEEIEIPALDHKTASRLKDLIGAFEHHPKAKGVKETMIADFQPEELVFQLNLTDILKLGVTANHIRNFFIILGVLFGISTQLGEFDSKYRIDRWIEYAIDNSGKFHFDWAYLLMVPFVVVISIIVSIFFSLFTNYNLRVRKTASGYRVNQGLINRNEQFAPFKKIQIVRWTISPLRRLLGLYNVIIKQASSSELSTKKSINIPGAPIDDVRTFLDRVFDDTTFEKSMQLHVSDKLLYRYFLYFVVIPIIAMLAANYFTDSVNFIYLAMLWAILVSLALVRYFESWKITVGESYLQLGRGILTMRRDRIFIHKLQGMRVHQTPYQVRKDLANVELHTAAGNLSIPYITLDDAHQLSNYLLYKVESSRKAWM